LTFNDLKCYRGTTWSSTNHLWTLIATEQHTKNFLSVWKLALVVFSDLFFWVLERLCWGGGSSFVWTQKTMEPCPWIRPALST
jgi:hypothetical protein